MKSTLTTTVGAYVPGRIHTYIHPASRGRRRKHCSLQCLLKGKLVRICNPPCPFGAGRSAQHSQWQQQHRGDCCGWWHCGCTQPADDGALLRVRVRPARRPLCIPPPPGTGGRSPVNVACVLEQWTARAQKLVEVDAAWPGRRRLVFFLTQAMLHALAGPAESHI